MWDSMNNCTGLLFYNKSWDLKFLFLLDLIHKDADFLHESMICPGPLLWEAISRYL